MEGSVHSTPHDNLIISTVAEKSSESQGQPSHPALSLVIYHLGLRELLAFQRVCKFFRDAIVENLLLWRDVKVEPPLSYRITDDVLWDITSRATGKLRSLALLNCWYITDAGLFRVIHANPCITKLHLPGCHKITGDGVVSMVRCLTGPTGSGGANDLNQLRLHGIRDLTKEHLCILHALLEQQNRPPHPQGNKPMVHRQWRSVQLKADESIDCHRIDIDICPKCNDATLVFDCTREKCRSTKERLRECRGCINCISRCEECSGCLSDGGQVGEETACSDVVCLECWLRLPKCNICNRPYCRRHWTMFVEESLRFGGYVCESCVDDQYCPSSPVSD